jgi:hypothetical protein
MASRFEEQQLREFCDGVFDMVFADRAPDVYGEQEVGHDGFGANSRGETTPTALETLSSAGDGSFQILPRTSLEASESG